MALCIPHRISILRGFCMSGRKLSDPTTYVRCHSPNISKVCVLLTKCTQDLRVMFHSKGKALHRTGHEGPEGQHIYSSTLPLTSALDGVDGQRHAPGALSPGKTRYPLYRRLGRPQGRSGRVRKISSPPGFDPRTFHPVASRCTTVQRTNTPLMK